MTWRVEASGDFTVPSHLAPKFVAGVKRVAEKTFNEHLLALDHVSSFVTRREGAKSVVRILVRCYSSDPADLDDAKVAVIDTMWTAVPRAGSVIEEKATDATQHEV